MEEQPGEATISKQKAFRSLVTLEHCSQVTIISHPQSQIPLVTLNAL